MKKENIKISSLFFVAFSLSAFALVTFLYLFLSSRIQYSMADKKIYGIEEVYQNEYYNPDDTFLTKASGFKNVISGPIISNFDPYLGSFDAPIRIIVYSDFTCSYCLEQEAIIKNIINKYEGKVRFIWKDYPETDQESVSFKTALAARCAQDQGKFWEFHDVILEGSEQLSESYYLEIAKNINLEMNDFESCVNNKKSMPLVMSNIEEANAIGVIGVPNVYINDKEFIGKVSEEDFSMIIESEFKNE